MQFAPPVTLASRLLLLLLLCVPFAAPEVAQAGGGGADANGAAPMQLAGANNQSERAGGGAQLQKQIQTTHYKLPTWFNFEAYKALFGKQYARNGASDELHKRLYLRTSLRVFEQRAQFRARRLDSLASVNELSDLTSEQLEAFTRGRNNTAGQWARVEPLPDCCTHDQLLGRIIGLLERASSSRDTELSRALLAELKQEPLLGEPPPPPNEEEGKLGEPTPTPAPELRPDRLSAGAIAIANADAPTDLSRRKRPKSSAGRDWPPATGGARPEPVGVAGGQTTTTTAAPGRPAPLEEQVRRQVAEQLSARSPLGRTLNKQLSDYFGEPVELRVRPAETI